MGMEDFNADTQRKNRKKGFGEKERLTVEKMNRLIKIITDIAEGDYSDDIKEPAGVKRHRTDRHRSVRFKNEPDEVLV